MSITGRYLITLTLLILVAIGCNNQPAPAVSSTPQNVTLESPPILSRLPTVAAIVSQPTTESPTEAATNIPSTSTPVPEVTVYVPDRWLEATISTFSAAELRNKWRWNLAESPDAADIILAEGAGQFLVMERPVALVVPFSSAIGGLTRAEAELHLKEDDSGIRAVDWADVPQGFRALRVDSLLPDEDGYPITREWSLFTSGEFSTPASELGIWLHKELSADNVVRLAAVGDIMLDRSLGYGIRSGDLLYPFANVIELLQSADITVGNLESALGNSGEPVGKSYTFRAPAEAAISLELAGFDILSLANNHAMDFGPDSLLQAIDLLEERSIATIGAGANEQAARERVIVETNGFEIAFLAYVNVPVEVTGFDTQTWDAGPDTPGLSWAIPEKIAEDVTLAQSVADVVVVLLHSGYEFVEQPSPAQVEASKTAIDAGASLVIGHHSHLLQGVEFYNDGLIVYGLGNFAFDMEGGTDSTILNVWLDENGVRNLEYTPVIIGPGGQPTIASSAESIRILEQIYLLSDLLTIR